MPRKGSVNILFRRGICCHLMNLKSPNKLLSTINMQGSGSVNILFSRGIILPFHELKKLPNKHLNGLKNQEVLILTANYTSFENLPKIFSKTYTKEPQT